MERGGGEVPSPPEDVSGSSLHFPEGLLCGRGRAEGKFEPNHGKMVLEAPLHSWRGGGGEVPSPPEGVSGSSLHSPDGLLGGRGQGEGRFEPNHCKVGSEPARRRGWPSSIRVQLLLILPLLLLTSCGQSARKEASDEIGKKLDQLSLSQVTALGPHKCESWLELSNPSQAGDKAIVEQQTLQWDGWDQYRYVIQKGDLTTLDVTLWKGQAFQRGPDGKVRTRSNLEEMHYYLRQTWNPWEGVIHPFRSSVQYMLEQTDELEGRPVDRYKIGFRATVEPDASSQEPTRRMLEPEILEGKLWLDKATQVPLQIDLKGAWKQVRFARRPGDVGETRRYAVAFKLRRYNIGKRQLPEPPEFVARP